METHLLEIYIKSGYNLYARVLFCVGELSIKLLALHELWIRRDMEFLVECLAFCTRLMVVADIREMEIIQMLWSHCKIPMLSEILLSRPSQQYF